MIVFFAKSLDSCLVIAWYYGYYTLCTSIVVVYCVLQINRTFSVPAIRYATIGMYSQPNVPIVRMVLSYLLVLGIRSIP